MTDKENAIGPLQTVEDAKEFWRDFGKAIMQGSISAIEESAKQVISVNGVLIGFYSLAVTLSEVRKLHPQTWQLTILLSPILLWLLSLVMALSIFWVSGYRITLESSLSAKHIIETMLQRKQKSLKSSFLFLIIGIVLLLMALALYMVGI